MITLITLRASVAKKHDTLKCVLLTLCIDVVFVLALTL